MGEKQIVRYSYHTVCHFPNLSKDSDVWSDVIFLAVLGALAWQSRQGMKQEESRNWEIVGRAPQKNALG